MSNTIVNIRFWYWHLQIGIGFRSISFKRNRNIKNLKGIPKIQVFDFFNLIKWKPVHKRKPRLVVTILKDNKE